MRRTRFLPLVVALFVVQGAGGVSGQNSSAPLVPVDAIAGIIEAFRSHDVVALPDAHGNAESHAFRLALIRDAGFAAVVDDVVIELGNALHQDLADRYVRGEEVPLQDLRKIWQDTTVLTAGNNYAMAKELLDTVRAVNTSRTDSRVLRVLLGDPPIDWSQVKERADYQRYFAYRQSHPVAVVIKETLARQRKALVMYGALHLQRWNIQSNYDMEAYQVQTIVGLLDRAVPTRVFTIWEAGPDELGDEAKSWTPPRLAQVRGTALGASDFAMFVPPRVAEQRGTFASGKFLPIPVSEFRRVSVEEQMDAVLYLGTRTPAAASHEVPVELCREAGFVDEHTRRILQVAPNLKGEAERLKNYCSERAR